MTIDTTTGELVAPLTEGEARKLTERIRLTASTVADGIEKLVGLIEQAQEGQAHVALGYASWTAYVSTEFAGLLPRLDLNARREITAEMRRHGMSTRAIAPVVGVDNATVHRDLKASGVADATPEHPAPIKGRDGKTYTRPPRPEPEPESEIVDAELVEDDDERGPTRPVQHRERIDVVREINRAIVAAETAAEHATRINRTHLTNRSEEATVWARRLSKAVEEIHQLNELLKEAASS